MNVLEKVCLEMGWDGVINDNPNSIGAKKLSEDEALIQAISLLQQFYIDSLRSREKDDPTTLDDYLIDKHMHFRNALVKHSPRFDWIFYEKWCQSQSFPNEFLKETS